VKDATAMEAVRAQRDAVSIHAPVKDATGDTGVQPIQGLFQSTRP